MGRLWVAAVGGHATRSVPAKILEAALISTTRSLPLTFVLAPLLGRAFKRAPATPPWNDSAAIREARLSVERLATHARCLALDQAVHPRPDARRVGKGGVRTCK